MASGSSGGGGGGVKVNGDGPERPSDRVGEGYGGGGWGGNYDPLPGVVLLDFQ